MIAATIPWTRVLRPGRVTYGQWTIDLLDFVSDNRARLVLKPASEYGGHGVALGMETEQGDWDRIIAEQSETGDFIVQEYVPVPEEMFPTVEDGHVQMRLKRFNINPFGIGGRYAGMITRISDQAVINVSAGGGLLPSVVGRHKRRLLAEGEGDDRGMRREREMDLGPDKLRVGYDVDESAIRFSNYFHVLRELVHLSCGWLALVPEFELKYTLSDHLHDDARAVSKIRRRLYELRHPSDYPGAPAEELSRAARSTSPAPRPPRPSSSSPTARRSRRCCAPSPSTSTTSTRSPTSPPSGC